MDYSKKIFEMLGVEPNEEFKIKEDKGYIYRIDKELNLMVHDISEKHWEFCNEDLHRLLNGTYTIEKIPKLTDIDKKARDYFVALNHPWIARDYDKVIYSFREKPTKSMHCWISSDKNYKIVPTEIFKFVSWNDKEPTDLRELNE